MTVNIKVCEARKAATQHVQFLLRLRFSILPGYWSGISVDRETFGHEPTESTDPQLHSARRTEFAAGCVRASSGPDARDDAQLP